MKRKVMLLFVLLMAAPVFQAKATHLLGGEITWECQPNGQFKFTMIVYRECGGSTAGHSTIASLQSNSPAGGISMSRISLQDVSPTCYASSVACNTSPIGYGAMERAVFQSANITINGIPPATGWFFWYSTCCRPASVNNIGPNPSSQGYVLRAIMFPYNNGSGNVNTFPCFDASPYFLEPPNVVTCNGFDLLYNNFGFDPDLDSLYYDWAQPLQSGTPGSFASVSWGAGFSATNPFPGNFTFDQNAGQIQIFGGNFSGGFVSCIKIESWRCGNNTFQKIAEVYREVPIRFLTSLNGCVSNQPPNMAISNYSGFPPVVPVSIDSLVWEATVQAGETVKFRIGATDYDMNPGFQFQNIDFFAAGGNLGNPWDNNANCMFNPPCATLTSLNTGSSYSSILVNEVDFEWTTDCSNLSYTAFLCSTPRNTYNFYFRMQDNGCPAPARSLRTIRINVVSFEPEPPDLSQSCVIRDANNDVTFNWTIPTDTGNNFDYYILYRSTAGPNGPYSPYDTLLNYLASSYVDNSSPNGPSWYYLTHRGGCSNESNPSDTVSAMWINLLSIPPASAFVAQLDWNDMYIGATNTYEIWRQTPNGIWSMIATTTDTNYMDTVNICGANINYQVRVNNQCVSNIKGGFFSDQANNDRLVIDSVSVVNNQTVISWGPTGEGDVVEYIILKFLQGQGWIPQDTVPVGYAMPYVFATGSPTAQREMKKIVSLDSCGNMSSDQLTMYHSNMFLRHNLNACNATITLNWSTYKNWPGGTQQYEIYVDQIDNNGIATDGILLGTYSPDDSSHFEAGLRSGYQYCYYVRARDTSGVKTSTSNRICIDAIVTQQSDHLYLGKADVRPTGGVDVKFYFDPMADVKHFLIQRSEEEFGLFRTLLEIDRPATAPYHISYTDYSAEAGLSYYYRIISIDSCDAEDTVSNFARTMLLTARPNGNMSNTLVWRPYRDYDQRVLRYEVYRKQDGEPNFTLVTNQVAGTDSVFVDDIRANYDGSGKFHYYVRAVEETNQWGYLDDGQPLASRSNIVKVIQEARVFIPTAFNPRSDVEANRVWKPANIFSKESSYVLSITNRWGQEVFYSDDPQKAWDGTYNGEPMPMGTYVYFIRYQSEDDVPIEKRGVINLIW